MYSLQPSSARRIHTHEYKPLACPLALQPSDDWLVRVSAITNTHQPPTGWRPDSCRGVLYFAIKNTKGIISAVRWPTSCIHWRIILTGWNRYLLVARSKETVNDQVDEGQRWRIQILSLLLPYVLSCFSIIKLCFYSSPHHVSPPVSCLVPLPRPRRQRQQQLVLLLLPYPYQKNVDSERINANT